MKKLFLLWGWIILMTPAARAADTMLVAGFINQGAPAEDNINEVLTTSLISLLSKVPEIRVIPYDEVKKAASGNGLWQSDRHDFSVLEAMGLQMGAKKVVIGEYKVSRDTINGTYYIYSMQTGELLMTRKFSGAAGIDLFDTVDDITLKISYGLLGREIGLASLEFSVEEQGKTYQVYVNNQAQGTVQADQPRTVSIIADSPVEVSLRLQDSAEEKEVLRKTYTLAKGSVENVLYRPSGIVLVKALQMPGALIRVDGQEAGRTDANGDLALTLPAGRPASVTIEFNGERVDSKKVSVNEGQTLVLAAGANTRRFTLGFKMLEGGGPSLMAILGVDLSPRLHINLGGGAAWYPSQSYLIPLLDLEAAWYPLSWGSFRLGGSAGLFVFIPGGSFLVSPLLRLNLEWKILYANLGVRYSFTELPEYPALKPILGIGVKFRL